MPSFLKRLDNKHSEKILYNIRKAQAINDSALFLAFWDKTDSKHTTIVATHGFRKKRSRVPDNEILRVELFRMKYFDSTKSKKGKNEQVHFK